jgi:hypothetical protein
MTESQMRGVIRANRNDGFELVRGPGEEHFNGVSFSRSDFRKNSVNEAVFVRACEAHERVFIFTGPDPEAVSKLIAQTRFKFRAPDIVPRKPVRFLECKGRLQRGCERHQRVIEKADRFWFASWEAKTQTRCG